MMANGFGSMPVVRDNRVIGIITANDIRNLREEAGFGMITFSIWRTKAIRPVELLGDSGIGFRSDRRILRWNSRQRTIGRHRLATSV